MDESPDNPNIGLTRLDVKQGKIWVVRDDVLPGGTKQRGAIPFLKEAMEDGYTEFVYASPMAGFAQIALAKSCQAVGARCTIHAELMPDLKLSEFSQSIVDIATVRGFDTLADASGAAEYYTRGTNHRLLIPLGFNIGAFCKHFRDALAVQWKLLCRTIGGRPARLWVPVGSGTFAGVMKQVVSPGTRIFHVDVGVLPASDPRISRTVDSGAYYKRVGIPFRTPCPELPPIPSNRYYDAKLWPVIREEALEGDVWWNIAG